MSGFLFQILLCTAVVLQLIIVFRYHLANCITLSGKEQEILDSLMNEYVLQPIQHSSKNIYLVSETALADGYIVPCT
jgi:hypothetical protein